jgi:hypothetical protein
MGSRCAVDGDLDERIVKKIDASEHNDFEKVVELEGSDGAEDGFFDLKHNMLREQIWMHK